MRFRGLLRAAILCLRTGMASISVPLSIVYDTKGATPLADVIAALQAADIAINDAVSLLPSFVNGLHIENSRVNVRSVPRKPASGAILGGVDRCLSGRFEFRDTADA